LDKIQFSLSLSLSHKSIAVIRSGIYRSPAMVTVDVFLVSLFVGAEYVCVCVCVCLFLYTNASVMNIYEGK